MGRAEVRRDRLSPTALAQAEAALARGESAQALALADSPSPRARAWDTARPVLASELALRALARSGAGTSCWRAPTRRSARASTLGFRTRSWRILAARARAREASGDAPGARDDRSAARALLDDMSRRIADPELRAAFEADPSTLEVRTT